ncbi:MAG: PEP-CTERM sorting domain-containing protein [Bryobacterales bacterium]|nr:PEP-CTERM sorting domain-containing protein [Bryobacterales bacterium]
MKFLLLPLLLAVSGAAPLRAGVWLEFRDAGNLPLTAQVTIGDGTLNVIEGSDFGPGVLDMYRIFLPNPQAFAAMAYVPPLRPSGYQPLLGYLMLFDDHGFGVAATPWSGPAPAFPRLGCCPSAAAPGLYYLAISSFWPLNDDGMIFYPPSGLPEGPGAAFPVTGWTGGDFEFNESYRIELQGAEFADLPEPSSLVLLAATAYLSAVGLRRRMREKA